MKEKRGISGWIERINEAIGREAGPDPDRTPPDSARRMRKVDRKATAPRNPAVTTAAERPQARDGLLSSTQPGGNPSPEYQDLEWESPFDAPATREQGAAGTITGSSFLRRKIRERYLNVRFPGTPHAEAQLRDTAGVIRSARLRFEDGDIDRACELLEFAGDVNADEALRLALLEILYLSRRGSAYREAAQAFIAKNPGSAHRDEIERLGARLLPGDALFKDVAPAVEDPYAHVGAWPQVQNWIQAPFDLTGDVLAAEFHAQMRGGLAAPAITAKASDQ